MKSGDHVHHKPSGEKWVVAWADAETGYMSPCGWPTCQAKIADCEIVKSATDEECRRTVAEMAMSGRTDANTPERIYRRALDGGAE